MSDDNVKQRRKWLLTFNNPLDHNFSHDDIKIIISKFNNVIYWCMSDEVGELGTPHTHLYLVLKNGVLFTTILNRFKGAHIDKCLGTSLENRDYVFKEGKWLDDPKGETNVRDSHEEYGELPIENPGKRTDIDELYEMIKSGYTNYEILEENPRYLLQIDKMDKARKTILENMYKDTWRNLEVTYIWGSTGSGKSRYVREKFGYSNVYAITDYSHPWDSYNGQDVILFEEFRSNLKIGDMLSFLDGYPLDLPCRYANKVACFTKVFFCTNIDLFEQYSYIQREEYETWCAFLRRIHFVMRMFDDKQYFVVTRESYEKHLHIAFENPFCIVDAQT